MVDRVYSAHSSQSYFSMPESTTYRVALVCAVSCIFLACIGYLHRLYLDTCNDEARKYLDAGRVCLDKKEGANAQALFQKALEWNPSNRDLLAMINGELGSASEDHKTAEHYFNQALQTLWFSPGASPSVCADVLRQKAIFYIKYKEFGKAYEALTEALSYNIDIDRMARLLQNRSSVIIQQAKIEFDQKIAQGQVDLAYQGALQKRQLAHKDLKVAEALNSKAMKETIAADLKEMEAEIEKVRQKLAGLKQAAEKKKLLQEAAALESAMVRADKEKSEPKEKPQGSPEAAKVQPAGKQAQTFYDEKPD